MLTGQIITKLRNEHNYTQEQLANKLFVSRELVSKWENGIRLPDYQTVLKIAALFSVDPETIIKKDEILFDELSGCMGNHIEDDTESLTSNLNAFLSTLNDRDRSVFIRRYYYMNDTSEISSMYGISENYVRTLLMRIRKKLKKYFARFDNE